MVQVLNQFIVVLFTFISCQTSHTHFWRSYLIEFRQCRPHLSSDVYCWETVIHLLLRENRVRFVIVLLQIPLLSNLRLWNGVDFRNDLEYHIIYVINCIVFEFYFLFGTYEAMYNVKGDKQRRVQMNSTRPYPMPTEVYGSLTYCIWLLYWNHDPRTWGRRFTN